MTTDDSLSKSDYNLLYELLYKLRKEVSRKSSPAYEPNKDRRRLLRAEIDSVKQEVLDIHQYLDEW